MLGKTALEIRMVSGHKSLSQLAAYVAEVQAAHGSVPIPTDELLTGLAA